MSLIILYTSVDLDILLINTDIFAKLLKFLQGAPCFIINCSEIFREFHISIC